MSLKVWLPLDGNLKNLGSMSCTITSNNLTYANNGKFKKCASLNGSNSSVVVSPAVFSRSTEDFSFCCWLKLNNVTGSHTFFVNRTEVNDSSIAAFLLQKTILFDCGNRLEFGYSPFQPNTWYHIAFTRSGSKRCIYINGDLMVSNNTALTPSSTANAPNTWIGTTQTGIGNPTNGCMNDVRFYDHCLTPFEVREISHCLTAHYKLDDFTTPNMLIDSNAPSISAQNHAKGRYYESSGGGTYTNTVVEIEDPPAPGIKYGVHQVVSVVSGFHSMTFYNGATVQMELDTPFTMSCYVKRISGTNLRFRFQVGAGSYTAKDVTIANDDHWHQYKWTFTPNSTVAPNGASRIYCGGLFAVGEVLICGYKLEKGKQATPWCPASSEPQFRILGNDDLLRDSSGYGHHAKAYGLFNSISDSRQYQTGIETKQNSSYATVSNQFYLPENSFTFSLWANIKSYVTGSKILNVNMDDNSFFNFGASGGTDDQFIIFNKSANTKLHISWKNIPLNEWHMWTGTYDGTTAKLYRDGSPIVIKAGKDNYTITGYADQCLFAAGTTLNPPGKYSDLRFYATALSENDVENLYSVSASIDRGNQFHARSYNELVDVTNVCKNSIVESRSMSELRSNLHYDKNVYKEPDGSKWVRIAHQNNPAVNRFSQTDPFDKGVYLNEDYWYDLEQNLDNLSAYEFMVKQATTAGAAETKYRWIQTVNPITATYDNVKPVAVTRVTTAGYTDGGFGGLFLGSQTSTRTRIANNTSSNWFGAFGSWTLYQGGTPGYPNTIVTTGYMDLYLRVDHAEDTNVKIVKDNGVYATQFIER